MEPDEQHSVAVLPVAFSAWQDESTDEIPHSECTALTRADFCPGGFAHPSLLSGFY